MPKRNQMFAVMLYQGPASTGAQFARARAPIARAQRGRQHHSRGAEKQCCSTQLQTASPDLSVLPVSHSDTFFSPQGCQMRQTSEELANTEVHQSMLLSRSLLAQTAQNVPTRPLHTTTELVCLLYTGTESRNSHCV